jgi:Protein of unknown function (DUF3800)
MLPEVAFDESGNTGQNLFDAEDPIFAIGSVHLGHQESTNAAKVFASSKAAELKFSKLRRRPTTRAAVLHFLSLDSISKETVKVYTVHKPFMVVTKFCDVFIEPSYRKHTGQDFYAKDLHVATANLIYHLMPTFLGKTWQKFLNHFVAFVRSSKQPSAREHFRRTAELIYNTLSISQPNMANFVGTVLEVDSEFGEISGFISGDELDPVFTCYEHIADVWGRQLNQRFCVLADDSKVLSTHAGVLRQLSDPKLKSFEAGYGERTTRFPLLVDEIRLIDSKADLRVQLADVIAGAATSCLKVSYRNATDEDQGIWNKVKLTMAEKQLFAGGIWPYHNLEQMFKDLPQVEPGPNQVSGPTYAAQILSAHPDVFRQPPLN